MTGRMPKLNSASLRQRETKKLILITFPALICIRYGIWITKPKQQAIFASIMELYFATSLAAQEDADIISDTDGDDNHGACNILLA